MTAPRKKAPRGFPLRPTLVTGVIGLILLAAGAVGFSAFFSSRRVVRTLWRSLAAEIAHNTTQRTLRFLEPARPAVLLEQHLAAEGRIDPLNRMKTLDYFHGSLLANPNFTWVSYGGADGTYLAVYRTPEGEIRGTWREQLPGSTPDKPLTRWRDFVPEGEHRWKTVRDDNTQPYDPRTRPWYAAASSADSRGIWVEPFLFTSHHQPGFIFAARDQEGTQLRGIWAIQYEVAYLSEFLHTLTLGRTGRVYVVTQSGLVVGHPAGLVTANNGTEIARAENHPDEMLRGAWAELQKRGPDSNGFSFGPYLAMVETFPPETGIDWRVIGVVPRDDFFGEARRQAFVAVGIGAICALLATLFGAMLSTRISMAMREISDEMDRVGRFEISQSKLSDEPSLFREVNALRLSTDRMKASLTSFGRYVPRELVQDLLLSGNEAVLGGQKREITTLFSDIAGFTTLSEQLAPEALVPALGEYFEKMSEAIREQGGTVDKYIGDAIMAFWGAPRPLENHAIQACKAALNMRDRLRELEDRWTAEGKPIFEARIGINTGVAVVGNIGSPNRMNYTAIGDSVNLASRLEGLNKGFGTSIVVGETTAALVKDQFVLRPLDWVAVKGKARAVLVNELVGEVGKVEARIVQAVELQREALRVYRARRFAEAHKLFLEVSAQLGGDEAALKLAERCQQYAAEPPPQSWNGSFTMAEK